MDACKFAKLIQLSAKVRILWENKVSTMADGVTWLLALGEENPSVTDGFPSQKAYRTTSNISRTLVGNKIVDNSDVVGAAPVGAAPTTSSFST